MGERSVAASMRRWLLPAVVVVAVLSAGSWAARGADGPPPTLAPEGGPWPAGEGFAFADKRKKTRQAVSGIACPPPGAAGERVCLFAFDEGAEARFAVLGDGRLKPLRERVVLRPGGGGEFDAEGAALDGGFFYVAGSHSARRDDCRSEPGRRRVVRFRRDPATGRAARERGGGLAGYADAAGLWAAMAALPELAPFVGEGKCLGTEPPPKAAHLRGARGVNIEGLAARAGRLFFGFRGPAVDGRAPVLSVDAAGLFGGGALHPQVVWLELGAGRGVRDLHAVDGGLLVLAGPDDDAANAGAGWVVAHWDGGAGAGGVGRPKMLGRLDLAGRERADCDKEVKPEAIAVMEESASAFRVVVLSDGMCDGGPLAFRVPR